MAKVPDNLQYTKEHEWVLAEGTKVRIGITDYAQEALGDIVYIQLPKVGENVTEGKPCGEVESTKSVSEIFSPVSGTVIAVNEKLDTAPETLNTDPYGAGWIAEIEVNSPAAGYLSPADYAALTA
jgi:glycine cleavage system H protein